MVSPKYPQSWAMDDWLHSTKNDYVISYPCPKVSLPSVGKLYPIDIAFCGSGWFMGVFFVIFFLFYWSIDPILKLKKTLTIEHKRNTPGKHIYEDNKYFHHYKNLVLAVFWLCFYCYFCSPGQNGRHFTDDNFNRIFVSEKFCILIKISLKFIPEGPIDNNPALV